MSRPASQTSGDQPKAPAVPNLFQDYLAQAPQAPERPCLVGVVHLQALPGAPLFQGDLLSVLDAACRDAEALLDGGCDAVIVENFGDVPFFPAAVPAETVAAMTLAVSRVTSLAGDRPVGVNVLRNDGRAALGICAASAAAFVRVYVLTSALVCDQGLIEGQAASLLRERARLCPEVKILADVHVKHASPLGSESPEEAACDLVRRALADAVIVTGSGTGRSTSQATLARVHQELAGRPLFIGSGLTESNAGDLLKYAGGAIVGTWLKRDGLLANPVDRDRVRRLAALFEGSVTP